MKYIFIPIFAFFIFSCNLFNKPDKVFNGIMIDCARLLEKKDYYYHLINFMSDWHMNTLMLHFSDDHGLSVSIPGFEKLARDNAFTPAEIAEFIDYGEEKGIEIVPEIETFGHTRYITDHPDYHHLYLGERTNKISFNAINPTNPQTLVLMDSLITAVTTMFSSQYIHLGCDEVNLDGISDSHEFNKTKIWTDYVNKLIKIVEKNGKTPIIWNDHVRKNMDIAKNLDKNVVLMEWNYDPAYKPEKLAMLYQSGFDKIIMAPSIACYRLRVLPAEPGLMNTNAMAEVVRHDSAIGLVNTIWLPMRYIQDAMWYGIAYSGYLINSEEKMDLRSFHEEFSEKVFAEPLTEEMHNYLKRWSELHLDYKYYLSIAKGELDFSADPDKINSLHTVQKLSKKLMRNKPDYMPVKNQEILGAMYLATRVIYVISEGLLIFSEEAVTGQRELLWRKEIQKVINEVDTEWDKGRYADDPNKYKAKFPNQEHSHLLIVLEKLAAYPGKK